MAPRMKSLRIIFPALAVGILLSFSLYMTFRTHHRTIKHPKGKTTIDLKHAEHKIFRNARQERRFGVGATEGEVLITQGANAQAAMVPGLFEGELVDAIVEEADISRKLIELRDVPALHAVGDEIVADTGPVHSWLHLMTFDKIVIMGALASQDTQWVHDELSDWSSAIYIVDNADHPAALHTPANKGSEALPYLTYIIEHYTTLPTTMAFVHSHKEGYDTSWHTDNDRYSNVWSLINLDTSYVQRVGFVNLRCTPEPGCPDGMVLDREPPEGNTTAEMALPAAIREMFSPDDLGIEIDMPPVLATPCCAQFAVSRAQVLQVPLRTYERMQRWVLETELNDAMSGRVMEYLWHIIFGRDAVFCPEYERCFCDVYGDCEGVRRREREEGKVQERAKEQQEERRKKADEERQKVMEREAEEEEKKKARKEKRESHVHKKR